MLNVMYSRYILTIAAFVIILLIDILYFTKPKISNKSKHKMFAFLISANTAILVLELAVMFVFGVDLSFTICAIVLHLRDLSMVVFFSCLLFYYYSAVSDVRYYSLASIFRDSEFKLLRPHLILTFIFVIVQFFLPYDVVDKNSFSVAWGGIAFYATIVYCVITTLETIFMIIFVVKKSINNSEKASLIWLFSIMMVILIFQPVFSGVAIMGICSAIYVLGLYFLLENPDLEMVEIIEALTEEVEQTNKSKSDFLSSVSKKMITPASSISELTEKVLNSEEWNNDEVKENLTQINHLSKEFLEVLDNAVDVSNAENDQNVLNENEYSLSALLRDLITSTKEKIANKRIELILHIDTSTPNTLYGDATKVYQVLSNVLTNSAKYTDLGKISLSLTKEIKNDKVTLKFKISDTGFGIKESDYDKIFQKYFRLDDAVSRDIDGAGIGLSVAKEYVDLLGGNIWFDSIYEAGTTFYVEITQQIVNMDFTLDNFDLNTETKFSEDELLDCSNYRILIVESDELNLEVTKRLFSRYGFKIETSTKGRECIYNYKKGEKYDMILVDHRMPEMSGTEVVSIIRKLKDYQDPPVVVIKANSFNNSKEMYLNEGFDDYLTSPIDLTELNSLVNKYFKKKN